MAALVPSPTKYHPNEWHASNNHNYDQSDKQRSLSEGLRTECERLCKEIEETTIRTQRDVGHKFSQRLDNISFWRSELETKAKEISDEIQAVKASKALLEEALENTNFPLEVAKSCLAFRQKRQGIDLVHDEVEIQLMKEVEVIEGIQSLLGKSHDEATEQIRLLCSCKYKLEKDLKDKFGALGIDEQCATLTDDTSGLGFYPEAVKIQLNSITPEKWQNISDDNIAKAEQQRIASTTLRAVISSLLDQTQQDKMKQRKTVNMAFNKRIHEVTQAREKLEEHLREVDKEILTQETNLEALQKAIESKTGPMQLAHTRLSHRSHRPNNELVKDPVQYNLVHEVELLGESVARLQDHYLQSETTLKKLNRTQLVLEEDIAVKTNSLMIDDGQCMKLRNQMDNNHKPD